MRLKMIIFVLMAGFGVITEVEGITVPSCHYSINNSDLKNSEMQEEIWKDVIGYRGLYKVSNKGKVMSLRRSAKTRNGGKRVITERILTMMDNGHGYLIVGLSKNGKTKSRKVHQLVAESFLNHVPCGFKLVVNHINFVKTDNRVKNLEIVTNRENCNLKHIKSSSQYIGVYWNNQRNKWQTQIWHNGKYKYLGIFQNEYDAHLAHQSALRKIEQ